MMLLRRGALGGIIAAATLAFAAGSSAQTVTEYPVVQPARTLATNGLFLTAGADGAVWFTGSKDDVLGRIATDGAVTFFTLPAGTMGKGGVGIATGPDGALWLAGYKSTKVAKVSTAGTVLAEYAMPTVGTADPRPRMLTPGPDGALWVLDAQQNVIGRFAPDGTATAFAIPTAASTPIDIVTGSDGALWFTEYAGNKIGRITTTGVVTEYPLPTAVSQPAFITAGPDGALWFTEINGRKIGRITTAGAITEFPTPEAAIGIAAGRDGLLYFGMLGAFGRMTTAGALSTISLEATYPYSQTEQMVVGPDNDIWFGDYFYGNMGRVALNLPPAIQAGAVFPNTQGNAASYLRFFNTGTAAGSVAVTFKDAATGQQVARWSSGAIPAGAEQQYAIAAIEAEAGVGSVKPALYSVAVETSMSGAFQNVLYNSGAGTLTNLSTCLAGANTDPLKLSGVHSGALDAAGFPSTILVYNAGAAPARAALGVYDARTGLKLGSYTTALIAAAGQALVPAGALEAVITFPAGTAPLHYVIRAEGGWTGYLQHLVRSASTGITTDMTAACRMN